MKRWWIGSVDNLRTHHKKAHIDGIASCFYNFENYLNDEKASLQKNSLKQMKEIIFNRFK